MSNSPHALRVFLCHSSSDKDAVRELYDRLSANGIQPWLDEKDILPGKDWEREIHRAVSDADVVLVCLSQQATTKAGFVQKEIKLALDVADMQPEGSIFVIPVKLEECEVPDRLKRFQWVNLFERQGYENLLRSLSGKASVLSGIGIASTAELAPSIDNHSHTDAAITNVTSQAGVGEIPPARRDLIARASRITSSRKFEAERNTWLHSGSGKTEAEREVVKFITELRTIAQEINEKSREMQFTYEEDGQGFYILHCLGFSLTASWNPGRFAGSLEGSGLHLKLFKGRISTRHIYHSTEPSLITHVRYDIDKHEHFGIVWRESDDEGGKTTISSGLAELWMRMLFHEIEHR